MTEKLLIVSADGHVAPDIETYRDYIDPEFRGAIDDLVVENETFMEIAGRPSHPTPEILEVIDDRGAIEGGGVFGCWDVDVRMKEIDADGIAGEILHPGHQHATLPFFSITNQPCAPELRAAGRRAYHRWTAEFMKGAEGRLAAVAEPGPCYDMDETLRELRWARENGFVSVSLPGTTADPGLPPLHGEHFEPFWAACEELGMVVSIHAGFGLQQGVFFQFFNKVREAMAGVDDKTRLDPDAMGSIMAEAMSTAEDSPLQLDLTNKRPLWLLMAGGVFDRHPGLKMALTEIRADWVPRLLAHLDSRVADGTVRMSLKPSEYFQRQIVVAPSSIHRSEVEMRHEIGVERLLFGTDYPHPEGTWPNTADWIRVAFAGVPEAEVRLVLGENAIDWYGLDRAKLRKVADRVGPDPSILDDSTADAKLIAHFDQRAGFSRAADALDLAAVDAAMNADLAALV